MLPLHVLSRSLVFLVAPCSCAPCCSVKVVRSDLKVESFSAGGVDQSTLNAYFERETAMATQVRFTPEAHARSLPIFFFVFSFPLLFFLISLMQHFTSNSYADA